MRIFHSDPAMTALDLRVLERDAVEGRVVDAAAGAERQRHRGVPLLSNWTLLSLPGFAKRLVHADESAVSSNVSVGSELISEL